MCTSTPKATTLWRCGLVVHLDIRLPLWLLLCWRLLRLFWLFRLRWFLWFRWFLLLLGLRCGACEVRLLWGTTQRRGPHLLYIRLPEKGEDTLLLRQLGLDEVSECLHRVGAGLGRLGESRVELLDLIGDGDAQLLHFIHAPGVEERRHLVVGDARFVPTNELPFQEDVCKCLEVRLDLDGCLPCIRRRRGIAHDGIEGRIAIRVQDPAGVVHCPIRQAALRRIFGVVRVRCRRLRNVA